MHLLRVEKSLKAAGEDEGISLFERYIVLKERLFTKEYSFSAMKFQGGNDHGPQHISRVLEKLDDLLGKDPVKHGLINAYELFLTMMSILYHDVGLLLERKEHSNFSGDFVEQEKNDYLFDLHDKDIIQAAVVGHSSQKDLEFECRSFSIQEPIGRYTVRPRVIASLVRLADELDEDYRRADPIVAGRLQLPEGSKFFWQFCQRISGIQPDQQKQEIRITVKFESMDIGRVVSLDGKTRSFLGAFAEKLAKINRERVLLNTFLPAELQYHSIMVSVRPLDKHETWNYPRLFVFSDHVSASEFIIAFPELLTESAHNNLVQALDFIRTGQLKGAEAKLQELEKVGADLPIDLNLRTLYDLACVYSHLAEKCPPRSLKRRQALDQALEYLRRWLVLGISGGWKKTGQTPENEIYKMSNDEDLHGVLSRKKTALEKMISDNLPPTDLPSVSLLNSTSRGGGGGCVPAGTPIWTPNGSVPIEDIQEGLEIYSIDIEGECNPVIARVTQVHSFRKRRCIRLNSQHVITLSQPLYNAERGWVLAGDLIPGMRILNYELDYVSIDCLEPIDGYLEVYTLSTDHPSHNYVADGLICHNKYPAETRYDDYNRIDY